MSTDERFIELWSDYLEGELDETGTTELRRLLAQDDCLVQTAADSYRTHRLLRLMAQDSESQQDDFVQQTLNRLPAEDGRFVGAVMRQVLPGSTAVARPRTRSLDTWRWIMRHPVSVASTAVIFVLAIVGVALLFHGGGTTPAFADFIKPILDAKTARYKQTTEMKGTIASTTTTVVMMLGASRSRSEMEINVPHQRKSKFVQIWDGYQAKSLHLEPEQKLATVYDYADRPKDTTPKDADPLGGWRKILLDAKEVPGMKREPLGEKDLDGRRVIGFRLTMPTAAIDVWGDPKTGMPVRLDITSPMMPNMKATMSDFELNVDLDESLFSVEPPAGYKVTNVRSPKEDNTPAGEKDLIETLRYYCELSGGTFPDVLNHETFGDMVYGGLWLLHCIEHTPEEQSNAEHYAAQRKFARCVEFVAVLPKESDSHYAGKDVSLGAADTPVFWYRPKDTKKYRVIYANLTVREAETPPSVPAVQPGQPENDLIEMLREYGEWSGGKLPSTLDRSELMAILVTKNAIPNTLEKQQNKLSAEKWKKIAQAAEKIHRGTTFVGLLPKEAEWHYAGKRVALGAADRPIFWYRPKDSKTYRVIFADLTVRETDAPPSVPEVPPEQDLIDAFREYGKGSDGVLPDSLGPTEWSIGYSRMEAKRLFFDLCTPENGKLDEEKRRKIEEFMQMIDVLREHDPEKQKPDKEQEDKRNEEFLNLVAWEKVAPGEKNLSKEQKNKYIEDYSQKFVGSNTSKIVESTMRIQQGLMFASQLPSEADAHYAGKGVSIGAADRPIFWYRPKDAKKYRVIYADFSVREAETPPSVPDAQPVPAPSSPKK